MQKLIDANNYKESLKALPDIAGKRAAIELMEMMPTIDPEFLPIVRQLRKELAQVKAERDSAEKDRAALANFELALCEEFCFGDMRSDIPPCEWYEDGACKLRKWRDKHAEAD